MALGVALAMFAPTRSRAQEQAQEQSRDAAPPEGGTADGGAIDPEARRLAERGLAHYQAGRYAEAIEDFQASYRLTPAPGLIYNLAQAQRRQGDCQAALESYRRFLVGNPTGNIRRLAEERIVETERCVSEKSAPARASAETIPAAAEKPPAVPSSSTAVSRARPVEPVRAPLSRRALAGTGLGAISVALGLASANFAWHASQASGDVSAIYDRGGTWGPYGMARQQSGQDDERMALWLGVSALASASLSLWLLLRR